MAANRTKGDEMLASELQEITKAGMRAKELVQQILTFSRQDRAELKPLQLQSIIKEVIKLLRATIPSTISIKDMICSDCMPVLADPTQIHQILMNLGTNAFQVMRETGGQLGISLSQVEMGSVDASNKKKLQPGTYNKLSVSVTGPGMDESMTGRIFEPYFTTKAKGKGTGLGLAVVHGIVKSCKGDIFVSSQLGKGTIFEIYLPVLAQQPLLSEEVVIAKTKLPTGKERIIVIDDEESIVGMQQVMLESLGYSINPFTSPEKALESLKETPDNFDMIITDMTMPIMTGDAVTAYAREIKPNIPVILCTGYSELINEEIAKDLGIDAYIMKLWPERN